MKRTIQIVLLLGLAFPVATIAQKAGTDHSTHPQNGQPQGAALTEGEVRKVDKEAKKITIKHGPLAKLDMPAMTMVFQVKDPAMLEQVKAGDKVKFEADKIGGAFTVTRIERAQ